MLACKKETMKDENTTPPTSGLRVTILEHPRGFLMHIQHDGASMTLNQDEALDLYEKLNSRLGEMPAKL